MVVFFFWCTVWIKVLVVLLQNVRQIHFNWDTFHKQTWILLSCVIKSIHSSQSEASVIFVARELAEIALILNASVKQTAAKAKHRDQ